MSLQGEQRSLQQLEDTQGAFVLKVVLSEETHGLCHSSRSVNPTYVTPLCKLLFFFLLWHNYEVTFLKSMKAETDKPEELKSDFDSISLNQPFTPRS